jgi:predicted SprT family Zn-dependent metalloprotease
VRALRACSQELIVYRKRGRVFAGAFIERQRIELNIDLLREATHACLLAGFHTTKRVVTHRLRITDERQLDDSIATLLAEA